ncbi:hypothetical protein SDJN02_15132, partial [Cucurbita argyrosperma subsp. argyrosperma]
MGFFPLPVFLSRGTHHRFILDTKFNRVFPLPLESRLAGKKRLIKYVLQSIIKDPLVVFIHCQYIASNFRPNPKNQMNSAMATHIRPMIPTTPTSAALIIFLPNQLQF